MDKFQLGKFGENIACDFLLENDYKIIERNFRKPWGELDIIAKAPDRTLVFVEVKTLQFRSEQAAEEGLQPEEQLTKAKLQKLKRAASLYAGHYPELIKDERGWRIDLLALIVKEKSYNIKYYENIA
ncbi:MAG: YraN family protein [Patescibacteria group bacterium]